MMMSGKPSNKKRSTAPQNTPGQPRCIGKSCKMATGRPRSLSGTTFGGAEGRPLAQVLVQNPFSVRADTPLTVTASQPSFSCKWPCWFNSQPTAYWARLTVWPSWSTSPAKLVDPVQSWLAQNIWFGGGVDCGGPGTHLVSDKKKAVSCSQCATHAVSQPGYRRPANLFRRPVSS